MDAINDPIRAILEKTGLSCDDLLQKLLAFKSQEKNKNNEEINCDGISSGKNIDESPDKSEECHENGIHSSNDLQNSTEENCSSSLVSDKINEKTNIATTDVERNISQNLSNNNENSSQNHLSLSTKSVENPVTHVETKEVNSKTIFVNEQPKNIDGEIPNITSQINNVSNSHSELSSIQVQKSIEVSNAENDVSHNTAIFPRGENCSSVDKNKETLNPTRLINNDVSEIEVLLSPNLKTDNKFSKQNSASITTKRKSISDHLVRRLVQRVNEDEINSSADELMIGKDIIDPISESPNNDCVDNTDEAITKPFPLLKLRTDLYSTDSRKPIENSETCFNNNKEVERSQIQDYLSGDIYNSNCAVNNSETDTPNKKIRKIKVGFLKKKNPHQVINRLSKQNSVKNKIEQCKETFVVTNSENEIEYSFQRPLPKLISEPHVETPEAQEEIRKNLKLQLSSLRNRKKTDNISDNGYCNKFHSIGELKFNYKKQLLNEEVPNSSTSALNISSTNVTCTDIEICQISSIRGTQHTDSNLIDVSENNVGSPVILSEETNFKIVDVRGGVDFLQNVESEESEYDAIKLTKTNDITKIKGWKNKKFDKGMKINYAEKEINDKQLAESHTDDKITTINANKDDSNSNETLRIEDNSGEELSPFVSNTLEEFLTENSRLNISYKIPKLGAEEGLREGNYEDIVLPQTIKLPQTNKIVKKDEPRGIKAKTLAEKRRMLESRVSKNVLGNKEDKLNISKTSYIYFNGLKVFIPSTSSNKCLANIRFKPSKCIKQSTLTYKSNNKGNDIKAPKKLSLLKLWLEKCKTVNHKPGPLSKKRKLQNSESISSWDTVIQRLPKVQLELIQEPGKKIPHFLMPFLPKPSTIIKSDYLEFALSAVHTKSSEKTSQGFRFSIPYNNNQKYILMRRKKKKYQNTENVSDIEPGKNSVASVIDDIIKYIEIKEIEDSLIKDAEPYKEEEGKVEVKPNKQNDINLEDNIGKKNTKRQKWEMELQRLSCKVVNVTVEDEEIVNIDCNKSFCQLGCICRSLACTSHLPLHCSKKDCMFLCKCSAKNGDITLSGIPLLSSDTVTRIEDQAKRNLARVEKEFTQTIIHADNKTILIPSSDRNKTKRLTRAPKRYSDFLDNYDVEQESAILPKENRNSQSCNNFQLFCCFVKLQKLDMSSVIPLCLDHNCYNCPCMKNIVSVNGNDISKDEDSIEGNEPPKKIKKLQTNADASRIIEENIIPKDHSSVIDSEGDNGLFIDGKGNQKEGCARVRGVHPEIAARNDLPFYKNKLRLRIRDTSIQNNPANLISTHSNYEEKHISVIDIETPMQILASERLKVFLKENNSHKRKQIHEVRNDPESEPCSKAKKMKQTEESSSEPVEENTALDLPYVTIFDGEIVIPTNANKDFVKNLGVKTVAPYMRLLPWNDLLKNYYSFKINIWCSSGKSDKLLINRRGNVRRPKGYTDIAASKRRNGIMTWILTKKLPKQTPPELVHLILSPKKNHFEISGICLKNINISRKKSSVEEAKDQNCNANKRTKHVKEVEEIETDSSKVKNPECHESNYLEHKNHKNELNVLFITEHEFCPQYFYPAEKCKLYNERFPLAIELPPSGGKRRWRMLYLNSNFSFLSFINNTYSIKYTDLMHILKEAKKSNKTICLQSHQLSSGYVHKNNFGIYAVPKFKDRLFIGPYSYNEQHGLETLRYLQKSLVTTSHFEMIQGISNPQNKNALWLSTKIIDMKISATHVSLLRTPSQKSLLRPNLNKLSIDSNENANSYTKDNEDFAELTPILNDTSPVSDGALATSDTVPLPDLVASSKTNEETDQRMELQSIQEHSKLLEGSDTFISSMDLDDKPFIKFPNFVLLNGRKMDPEDYNRYIMTNIPHFGYLGAYQDEKSIYINWPFGNKILKFPSVNDSIEFLKIRFTNLLLPIPASFQINFIMLTEIDHSNNSPIDIKVLNGTYICGEFGVLDSRKLTSSLAKSLGTSQEEVLRRLAKRAHYLVRCRLRTLGLFLLPNDEKLEEVLDNVAYVTNLGTLEIANLKTQEKKLLQQKKVIIQKKQDNLAKFMELLMHLPEKRRLEEYDKFRQQFNERGKLRSNSNSEGTKSPSGAKGQERVECIQIEDSDSENEISNNISGKSVNKSLQLTPLPEKSGAMKSILKYPPPIVQIKRETSNPTCNYKFIKSASGKLVLVKDNSGGTLSTSLSGMKMTIRNNQVIFKQNIIEPNNVLVIEDASSYEENHPDVVEKQMKNSENDSVITLNESDSDLELLE